MKIKVINRTMYIYMVYNIIYMYIATYTYASKCIVYLGKML